MDYVFTEDNPRRAFLLSGNFFMCLFFIHCINSFKVYQPPCEVSELPKVARNSCSSSSCTHYLTQRVTTFKSNECASNYALYIPFHNRNIVALQLHHDSKAWILHQHAGRIELHCIAAVARFPFYH